MCCFDCDLKLLGKLVDSALLIKIINNRLGVCKSIHLYIDPIKDSLWGIEAIARAV